MSDADGLPLFEDMPRPAIEAIAVGVTLLPGFVPAAEVWPLIGRVADEAPFRLMTTPGGRRMSVAMTNCGDVGWVTDRGGYRYDRQDPESGRPWPAMPDLFATLATAAAARAGFAGFAPDACLINRYDPGARLGLHRDEDEKDFGQPIVSFSLGLPAVFLLAGATGGRSRQIPLRHGDAIVFGGPARLWRHGVKPLNDGVHPLTGRARVNLTFRKAL